MSAGTGRRRSSESPARPQPEPPHFCFIHGVVSCIIPAKDSETKSRLKVPGLQVLHRERVLFQQQSGDGVSPEPRDQWAPVSLQVMRGTGVEMQMLSRVRPPRHGAGARENTARRWGGSNGGSKPAGPSAVAMAKPYSPARSIENPLSRAQERLISLPRRGRGRQLGVGFSKLFFSSFIPLLPSCQLPQEGPVLPLHLVVPAKKKKCHRSILEQGLVPGFPGCQGRR